MKTTASFMIWVVMALSFSACGFFDFSDPEQVQTCCECLAENQRPQTDAGVGTYDVSIDELSRCIDGSENCLCGLSAESCFQKLTEERAPVPIIGACAASGGPCEPVCERALLYEPATQ